MAGCEAALQLARRGVAVTLWEQRLAPPHRDSYGNAIPWSPAHETSLLGELVCSNSLKSNDPERAPGLLKEELRRCGSALLAIADSCALPGGAALVVDRALFAERVTEAVRAEPLITLRAGEFSGIDKEALTLIASGPLTSGALWEELSAIAGGASSYFFDATSPIVEAGGIDRAVAFAQSRYDKGEGDDYLNCPLNREQYLAFREALSAAERYPLHPGEEYRLFEGCLPVEELAARGEDTLRFGPLKPKGLTDPATGRWPYAAVQLRYEDTLRSALSLVGFQTRLRQGEQERVFRMIPGLAEARFLRYGRMHRNSYLDAPHVLMPTLQLQGAPRVLVAGQLTGLEGYLAAIATGCYAGLSAAWLARGEEPRLPPEGSCLRAMLDFMSNPAHKAYAPTAFQFGMLSWLPERLRRAEKRELIARRTGEAWAGMLELLSSFTGG